MHYWNGLAEVPAGIGPTVVTIGNFDGVHLGHQHVLDRLVKVAREKGAAAVAISFDPHPAQVHRPETAPELIMGPLDRREALAATGLDGLLMLHYNLQLASLTPEEFVRQVFVDGLQVSAVVIGHDVRFGRGNSGDLETMRQLGAELGFDVQAVEDFGALPDGPAATGGRRCSSTWIREALRSGDVRTASRLLGRTHRMRGEVIHGAARGRELGFPTANLAPEATGLIPADGIYAGWLVDEAGTRWPAAISVGSNPTFDGVSRQVEAHVIDRPDEKITDFDLYGQHVVVEFVERLRGMVAYTGPEALIEQMRLDVARTRAVLSTDSSGDR
ncbi:bifunctional riboflavin kinase/FAD synthetase [Arthrobacter sp. APC 3897]|uniref:bifunctional riboflavin kinase/FAD synthetase n=1 Tax=Arthrobacter sp. APC 3897 TaxID=3035204 RepID=UPI0025B294F8|nr:bifunctional riboflavin kinase/FAD synthetase [Arthrobacter sp. APC 3897]MDN3481632.1 bifunctional riboflavin kinase/FAD synthetase [Arthrobacter sp. APC 3897]